MTPLKMERNTNQRENSDEQDQSWAKQHLETTILDTLISTPYSVEEALIINSYPGYQWAYINEELNDISAIRIENSNNYKLLTSHLLNNDLMMPEKEWCYYRQSCSSNVTGSLKPWGYMHTWLFKCHMSRSIWRDFGSHPHPQWPLQFECLEGKFISHFQRLCINKQITFVWRI